MLNIITALLECSNLNIYEYSLVISLSIIDIYQYLFETINPKRGDRYCFYSVVYEHK